MLQAFKSYLNFEYSAWFRVSESDITRPRESMTSQALASLPCPKVKTWFGVNVFSWNLSSPMAIVVKFPKFAIKLYCINHSYTMILISPFPFLITIKYIEHTNNNCMSHFLSIATIFDTSEILMLHVYPARSLIHHLIYEFNYIIPNTTFRYGVYFQPIKTLKNSLFKFWNFKLTNRHYFLAFSQFQEVIIFC